MIKNSIAIVVLLVSIFIWNKAINARFTSLDTHDVTAPVVVELFTSQSCSSCPPADENLAALSKNPNIIALSFHVTYWDHLHWKDTLGKTFSDNRQRGYQRTMSARNVYTPQMIVNGTHQFVGSNRSNLNDALRNVADLQNIGIEPIGSGAFEITLPQMPNDDHLNYSITIFGTKSAAEIMIRSGENRGKTIRYSNVVRHAQPLGGWIGEASKRVISLPPGIDADRVVILAQAGAYGEIVAAGQTGLR